MGTGTIIRIKGIFVLNYSDKSKKIICDINVKSISDNKKFCITIRPFFANKGLNKNNMMLVKNNRIVREEKIIANIMNNVSIMLTYQN